MIHLKIRRRYSILIVFCGVFFILQAFYGTIVVKYAFLNLYPFRPASLKTGSVVLPDAQSYYYLSIRNYTAANCQASNSDNEFLETIIQLTNCVRRLAEARGVRPVKAERVSDIDFIKFFSKKEAHGHYQLECAAFTSLLKAALTANGFYVRRVDLSDFGSSYGAFLRFLVNFFPSSSQLIFYRHQVLEIWDHRQDKWIFWDGFYGRYAISDNDSKTLPISTVEVQNDPLRAKFVAFSDLSSSGIKRYTNLFEQIAIGRILDSEYEMQLHSYKDELGPAYRSFYWRSINPSDVYKMTNLEFDDYFSESEELMVADAIRQHRSSSKGSR